MSATHETPRVADTYHLFLLSLYESLAQAVNPRRRPRPAAHLILRRSAATSSRRSARWIDRMRGVIPCQPDQGATALATTVARFLRGDRSR